MGRWLRLVARLLVGGIWLWAGLLKLPHPEASVTAVRGYQLLPTGVTDAVGRLLPLVEVTVGVLLVLGLLTRFAGAVSAVLQMAFVVGIVSVWARGIAIDCGCFGDGGPDPEAFAQYPWEIARDVGLLVLSLWLVWRPRSAYAVDDLLFPVPSHNPAQAAEPETSGVDNRVPAES